MSNFIVVSPQTFLENCYTILQWRKLFYVKINSIKFASYPFKPTATSYTHWSTGTHIHTNTLIPNKTKQTKKRSSSTVTKI